MFFSRRDLGKLALASLPAVKAFSAMSPVINSKFNGVQIGVQTYSFRSIPDTDDIIKAMVTVGLGEAELMSEHAEAIAGAPKASRAWLGGAPGGGPPGGGRGGAQQQLTPEEREARRAQMREAQKANAEALRKWRLSTSMDAFKPVRQKFDAAGIELALLCFNMNEGTTDDEIDYGFQLAKALGVRAMTTSTQLTVSKRVAPFADKYKMMVGYHGHDATDNPNEFATPATFETAMGYSKYHGINLDIGHFVAGGYDPIDYIPKHADRITNLHIKDRKKNHGPNTVWGQGDTPIKPVLQLLAKQKYPFPANIEFEYNVPEGSDATTEVAKCLKYCKDALA